MLRLDVIGFIVVTIRQCVADRPVLSRLKVKNAIILPAWYDVADTCDDVVADTAQVTHC